MTFSRSVECPLPESQLRRLISHSSHEAQILSKASRRALFDSEPDTVSNGNVGFQHLFETIEDSETFCDTTADVVDADDAS